VLRTFRIPWVLGISSCFLWCDAVEAVEDLPGLGEGTHQIPEAGAPEAVFGNEVQFGGHAAGILEPDLVDGAGSIGIVEEGRLGGFVILDGDVIADGQLDGVLVGDGLGPGDALHKGKRPVVAVVGDAQENFSRGNLRDGVVQHGPDVREWGNSHRRTGGIATIRL